MGLGLVVAFRGGLAPLHRPLAVPSSGRAREQGRAAESCRRLLAQVGSLDSALADLQRNPSATSFRSARRAYKHLEGALEFYAPALAAALNSRRQEVDDDDAPPPSTLSPSGFPVVEQQLFVRGGRANVDSTRRAAAQMRAALPLMRSMFEAARITDVQLLELGRQEIARVSTLGIAGFDTPVTGDALVESADALDGLRMLYRGDRVHDVAAQWRALDATLGRAAARLRQKPDFISFDRLDFLVHEACAAAHALAAVQRVERLDGLRIPRAWRADVPFVYDSGAFDASAYAPAIAPPSTPTLVALGARLFRDPILSGPQTRSCVTCHQPGRAFTDGLTRAAVLRAAGGGRGGAPGRDRLSSKALATRNTPTLLNAGFQPAQFADERSVTLEDQLVQVLRSPAEMGSSVELAATRLQQRPDYRAAFGDAFGAGRRGPHGETTRDQRAAPIVTVERVRVALAAYVRSLSAMHSRFDRAVQGDSAAMTAEERLGFDLFMGKGRCGTCHFAPLFSGVTPPAYIGADVEVIGAPADARRPDRVDSDSGRAAIDHLPIHLHAFKTPSLRNVVLTAPYMHNGVFRTLEQVTDFYDGGGGRGKGANLPNQTLAADSLHLTPREKRAIIAFLRTLTDSCPH